MASDMFPRPPKATIISLALVFIFVVVYYLPYHTTEIDNLSGLLLDEKWGFFESHQLAWLRQFWITSSTILRRFTL